MEQAKYKVLRVDGFDYVCIDVERNDDGIPLLEIELKKRIIKLQLNIKKAGSYEKMLEIGGMPTQRYILHTRNLLRQYLHMNQIMNLLTVVEDIKESAERVNEYGWISDLVAKASWEEIENTAYVMRCSLVDNWYLRLNKRNQTKLSVA